MKFRFEGNFVETTDGEQRFPQVARYNKDFAKVGNKPMAVCGGAIRNTDGYGPSIYAAVVIKDQGDDTSFHRILTQYDDVNEARSARAGFINFTIAAPESAFVEGHALLRLDGNTDQYINKPITLLDNVVFNGVLITITVMLEDDTSDIGIFTVSAVPVGTESDSTKQAADTNVADADTVAEAATANNKSDNDENTASKDKHCENCCDRCKGTKDNINSIARCRENIFEEFMRGLGFDFIKINKNDLCDAIKNAAIGDNDDTGSVFEGKEPCRDDEGLETELTRTDARSVWHSLWEIQSHLIDVRNNLIASEIESDDAEHEYLDRQIHWFWDLIHYVGEKMDEVHSVIMHVTSELNENNEQ